MQIISTAASNPTATIELIRGATTFGTDANTDWRIQNTSTNAFAISYHSTPGSLTTALSISNAGVTTVGALSCGAISSTQPITVTTASGAAALTLTSTDSAAFPYVELVRGATNDAAIDWRIENSGLFSISGRDATGTYTNRLTISSTGSFTATGTTNTFTSNAATTLQIISTAGTTPTATIDLIRGSNAFGTNTNTDWRIQNTSTNTFDITYRTNSGTAVTPLSITNAGVATISSLTVTNAVSAGSFSTTGTLTCGAITATGATHTLTSTGATSLQIISAAASNSTIDLIRGSNTFGGDANIDWRIQNTSANAFAISYQTTPGAFTTPLSISNTGVTTVGALTSGAITATGDQHTFTSANGTILTVRTTGTSAVSKLELLRGSGIHGNNANTDWLIQNHTDGTLLFSCDSTAITGVTTLKLSNTSVIANLTTDATNATTGALVVNGGVGIAKQLFVGETLSCGTTIATGATHTLTSAGATTLQVSAAAASASTIDLIRGTGNDTNADWRIENNGTFTISNGVSGTTTGRLRISSETALSAGNVSILNTTPSTSATTGALIVSGGVGIASASTIGGNLTLTTSNATTTLQIVNTNATPTATIDLMRSATFGTHATNTDWRIQNNGSFAISYQTNSGTLTTPLSISNAGILTLSSNITSNSTTTGTLVVTGGVGVSGQLTAGSISTGTFSATNLGGTLSTASQPNITSVGTLTSLSVTNALSAGSATVTNSMTAGTLSGGSGSMITSSHDTNFMIRSTTSATNYYPTLDFVRGTAYGGDAVVDWRMRVYGEDFSFYSNKNGSELEQLRISYSTGELDTRGGNVKSFSLTTTSRCTIGGDIDSTTQLWVRGASTYGIYVDSGRVSIPQNVEARSDYRLKSDVQTIEYGLAEILRLNPVSYTLDNYDHNDRYLGFIAHEAQEHVPEIVSGDKDALKDDGTPDYQTIAYATLVPVLTKAIQEQQVQIEDLKQKNADLEARLKRIEDMLANQN